MRSHQVTQNDTEADSMSTEADDLSRAFFVYEKKHELVIKTRESLSY